MSFKNPFVEELAELFARDSEQESTLFNAIREHLTNKRASTQQKSP